MGTIALTPAELSTAASKLHRAGDDLTTLGVRTVTGTGDLGAPELERAVARLADNSLQVVVALSQAVAQTGENLAASASAYVTVDTRSMRGDR